MNHDWDKIWDDQATFNLNFRQPPTTFEAKSAQTRDFVVELVDEAHELLRTMKWKHHRKQHDVMPNASQSEEEIADIFKNFISLCQIHRVTPERLMDLYWMKSMVCVQRHAEEFIRTLDRPAVIIDLDNVLCDYIQGIIDFVKDTQHLLPEQIHRMEEAKKEDRYVDEQTVLLSRKQWDTIKHAFRISGRKASLPAMAGARTFVDWCKEQGWMVVILTARHIDQYPTVFTDTVKWLHVNGIQADFIWWAADKAKCLEDKGIAKHVVFAVDDDERHIDQYSDANIRTFWRTTRRDQIHPYHGNGKITRVSKLMDIPEAYGRV